jgi:predicted transcriptional regulator
MTPTVIELPDDVLAQARDLAQMTNRRTEEILAEAVMRGLYAVAQEPLIPDEAVWADFLQRGLLTPEAIARVRSSPRRILGLNRGAITTTADFDAPLPDTFWLGEM